MGGTDDCGGGNAAVVVVVEGGMSEASQSQGYYHWAVCGGSCQGCSSQSVGEGGVGVVVVALG